VCGSDVCSSDLAPLLQVLKYMLFFFQAEDGIRVRNVTGVQTCALPISKPLSYQGTLIDNISVRLEEGRIVEAKASRGEEVLNKEIGRASCRERDGGLVLYYICTLL